MTLIEGDEVRKEPLDKATQHVLEECRMVLPGIQALFGFQLIAVFNSGFRDTLSHREQIAHLVAVAMTAIAVALVMGPAAYHRQVHPESVSKQHLRASSWMLTLGMIPLMLAITIDLHLIARLITQSVLISAFLAGAILVVFVIIWIIIPRTRRVHPGGKHP